MFLTILDVYKRQAHIRLGVDSRHADQQVRGAVVLPNGTGKNVRVCVFCKEDKYDAAKEAGAEFVGGMDLVDKIMKENWMDFDVVVASPDMMGLVGRLGKVLGPRAVSYTHLDVYKRQPFYLCFFYIHYNFIIRHITCVNIYSIF